MRMGGFSYSNLLRLGDSSHTGPYLTDGFAIAYSNPLVNFIRPSFVVLVNAKDARCGRLLVDHADPTR